MAINYTVQAEVIDITADTPKAEDAFLVDTNVWYWLTYSKASQSTRPPADYQTSNYPPYTNAALGAKARIFQSGLSLAELTHLIEKAERGIFETVNGPIGTKEYRHNLPAERAQVFAEAQAACGLVTTSWGTANCHHRHTHGHRRTEPPANRTGRWLRPVHSRIHEKSWCGANHHRRWRFRHCPRHSGLHRQPQCNPSSPRPREVGYPMISAFQPKFTITNCIIQAIIHIEQARGFLEAAQLSAD